MTSLNVYLFFVTTTDIERCHVHLDWETEHKAEHQGKDGGLFSLSSRPDVSPRAADALAARTVCDQEVSSGAEEAEAGNSTTQP